MQDSNKLPGLDTKVQQGALFAIDPGDQREGARAVDDLSQDLCQWMTPAWAAEELVARHFADLCETDLVVEPSCGTGAFLGAIPSHVGAIGVEIDPALAARARAATNRKVIVGDFRHAALPNGITAVIGNPPFPMAIVQGFLERAWSILPNDGRVGLVLPVSIFQTASTVAGLATRWGIAQELIPRNLFRGLRLPLCFAVLTKGYGKALVGFALFRETHAINQLRDRYRKILASGERSVWVAVVKAALETLGGKASLQALYAEIDGNQPTENRFWREKVRQTLQRMATSCGAGEWKLAA